MGQISGKYEFFTFRIEFFLGILNVKACKSVCLDLMYSAVAEELNFGLKYGSWRLNGLCAWPDATYIFLESAKY